MPVRLVAYALTVLILLPFTAPHTTCELTDLIGGAHSSTPIGAPAAPMTSADPHFVHYLPEMRQVVRSGESPVAAAAALTPTRGDCTRVRRLREGGGLGDLAQARGTVLRI